MYSDMKISVVIPVFNVAGWLSECLDSVLKSVGKLETNWSAEIICVDDGSSDGSSEILGDYTRRVEAEGRRVRFISIRQANAGVSVARNRGIEVATGEWIAFVDGDDCVALEWFSMLAQTAEKYPRAEIIRSRDVISAWNECEMAQLLERSSRSSFAVREYVGLEAVRWGRQRYARDGWSMLNLVRRDFIGSTRFPIGMRIKEDIVFFTKLAERLNRAVEIEYRGYFYRRREGSALRSFRRVEDSVRFFEEMVRFDRFEASRAIGHDLIQWMQERDWSCGYDGFQCPLRAVWCQAIADGQLDFRGIRWWWRGGIRYWLRTGSLAKLQRRWKWRVKIGIWTVKAGQVIFGKRWTRKYI